VVDYNRWLSFLEAKLLFSTAHKGKEIKYVPSDFLRWALKNVAPNARHFPPDHRKEAEEILKQRSTYKPTNSPAAASTPPQQQAAEEKPWILAKVTGPNNYNLVVGQSIAVSQGTNGWNFASLDGPQMTGTLHQDDLGKIVISVKDNNGQRITGNSPEELKPKDNIGPTQIVDRSKYQIPSDRISNYQKAIEDEFVSGNKNIVINALAGTGKTTLLRHLAGHKKPNERWLYLVFNKKNQVEATSGKSPFPPGVDVKTTHSFLGEVLRNNSKVGKIQHTDIGKDKIGGLLDGAWFAEKAEQQMGIPKNLLWPLKSRVKKIASLAKAFAIMPDANVKQNVEQLMHKYGIDGDLTSDMKRPPQNPVDYTQEVITLATDILSQSLPGQSSHPELRGVRDHDDTLWYAAIHADEIHWPQYDVVLADEVQDFNKAQLIMLKKLGDSGARIVAVGDPHQSLYSFRGADSEAFGNVQSLLGGAGRGAQTFDLPTNYRSGKNIIDFVNKNTHVKGLKAGKDHDGVVTNDKKYSDVQNTVSEEWNKDGKLKMETAYIARTNKPLVLAALHLIKSHIPFVIIGRDFADDLVKFVRRVSNGRTVDIQSFWNQMHQDMDDKRRWYTGKAKKEQELKEAQETTDALDEILQFLADKQWGDVKTSEDFVNYLKRIFGGLNVDENAADAKKFESMDPHKFVVLTTAHRSKGLEFKRVFLLRNDLFPHPSAKTPDELAQEGNAKYVAKTRATHELHVLNDDQPGGKK
jgi:DNA helicase II / ATP-dependent DNA helicase PcrA